jgi:hypothetical protein
MELMKVPGQAHTSGDTLMAARVLSAAAAVNVQQVTSGPGKKNFARILILQLIEATPATAIAE